MKYISSYKLFESYEFSDIELQIHDILQELEDEGLNFGTKRIFKHKKVEVVISNHHDVAISNLEVFKHVKRLIDFMKIEGFDTYGVVVNHNNVGSSSTNSYELLDDYLKLYPREKKSNGNNFRYLEISFHKQRNPVNEFCSSVLFYVR